MQMRKAISVLCFVAFIIGTPRTALAFDVTGGSTWQDRVGPGISFSVGLNGCARDYCDDVWDTGVSIGATVGFFWRIIPNLVVFGEMHTGHIPADADRFYRLGEVDNDNAFAFQATAGAEFHLPLTGWVAPFAGFGMGFAYLGLWGEYDTVISDEEFHNSLRGLDFQLRFGADFYPFSRVSSLSLGPVFFFGLPYWTNACWEVDGDRECDDPDDLPFDIDDDDTPFIIYIGVGMRYGF